jgi:hypothetical protein
MMNWMKSVDLEQVRDQIVDLKDQVQDIRFRKPWTRGDETSPLVYMAVGAALAWGIRALYKNREEVASFCNNCGSKLKDTWEQSGLKEKAEKAMNKTRSGAKEAMAAAGTMSSPANGQEPLY